MCRCTCTFTYLFSSITALICRGLKPHTHSHTHSPLFTFYYVFSNNCVTLNVRVHLIHSPNTQLSCTIYTTHLYHRFQTCWHRSCSKEKARCLLYTRSHTCARTAHLPAIVLPPKRCQIRSFYFITSVISQCTNTRHLNHILRRDHSTVSVRPLYAQTPGRAQTEPVYLDG